MKQIIRISLVIGLVYTVFLVHLLAQQASCSLPITSDSNEALKIIQEVKVKVSQDIAQLPNKHRTKITAAYTKRADNIINELEQGTYYFAPPITDYFNSIFQQIVRTNPSLSKVNLNLLVSRYPYPNAYCTGAGTIVFNLELLSWLENDSQIAFVLCHEIAHHTLNHVNVALREKVNRLNSKKTWKELSKIKESEVDGYTKANKLLQGLFFEERRHSRLYEAEADSLALVYLKNTAYDITAAIRCLELLDKVDGQRLNQSINLEKTFHTAAYPFKKHWLEEEVSIFATAQPLEEWDKDSIKTHPDCSKRIQLLQPHVTKYQPTTDTLISKEQKAYEKLRFQADFELVKNTFSFQNWGRSLYYTLLLLEKHPEEACLHAMVGKNLYHLHQAQSNHDLEEYLEHPAPWQEEQYKTLLEFLQNLRLKELANLNYQYLATKKDAFLANQAFHAALLLAADLVANEAEFTTLETLWQERYPTSEW